MRDDHRVTDEELKCQTRSRLLEGRLPIVDGVSRSRRGTGHPCIVCRGAIEPTEVERQADGAGVFLFAHEVCYKLWHDESVALRAAEALKVQRRLVELEGEEP